MAIVARGFGLGASGTILVTAGYGLGVFTDVLGGGRVGRFTPGSEFEFERLYKRVKKSLAEAFKSQPLTASEQAAIEQSLRGYMRDSGPRTADETRRFVEMTIAGVQRTDLERRAASQQFAEDLVDAREKLRIDNRRRAIILVILLMLL